MHQTLNSTFSILDFSSCQLLPDWLYRSEIYQQLGVKSWRRDRYRAFVEMGVDEEAASFYGKGNQKSYLARISHRLNLPILKQIRMY